jgi:uncharacterized membrane protein YkvA (DUF1232 family)
VAAGSRLRRWAAALQRDAAALWFAYRHPRTPRLAKIVAMLIVAYALSPIDLIPDFVPVLGYLDELILLPGAIWLAIRLIPADVLAECRRQAAARAAGSALRPKSYAAAAVIVLIWLALAWLIWRIAVGLWRK